MKRCEYSCTYLKHSLKVKLFKAYLWRKFVKMYVKFPKVCIQFEGWLACVLTLHHHGSLIRLIITQFMKNVITSETSFTV